MTEREYLINQNGPGLYVHPTIEERARSFSKDRRVFVDPTITDESYWYIVTRGEVRTARWRRMMKRLKAKLEGAA